MERAHQHGWAGEAIFVSVMIQLARLSLTFPETSVIEIGEPPVPTRARNIVRTDFDQDTVQYQHTVRYSILALGLATHYET